MHSHVAGRHTHDPRCRVAPHHLRRQQRRQSQREAVAIALLCQQSSVESSTVLMVYNALVAQQGEEVEMAVEVLPLPVSEV